MQPDTPHPDDSVVDARARVFLDLAEGDLLGQCAVDVYRASGPGGQKRNKTSSAVRLRHKPTGLIVTATESRLQQENRARALRRLRHAIALYERNQVDREARVPDFFAAALARDAGLRVNRRHPDYCHIVQYVLDVLSACRASVGDAAGRLGISTGHLVRFLKNDPKLWEHANRLRERFGHPSLR
jgi:hypothetical protein